MFLFLHIMTTNRPWIIHELFSTTDLHKFLRIIIQHRDTKTQSFFILFWETLAFFYFSSTQELFLYFFRPFLFPLSNRAHTIWYGEIIKKRFASKKNIKTGLADIPQTPMLTKKRQGVRKKGEKRVHKTHGRGAVRINEQFHGNYMFLFLHIMTTNRPWIFHELFSTTNLHKFPRIF